MKINISKKEYRILVEMLYLADWMIHSHNVERPYQEHEELKKKFLSFYKEMDAEDIIEQSKESNDYYEVSKFDDYIHEKFINYYDNETFWDELIDRLAMRDLINEIGIEHYKSLEGFDRVTKTEEKRNYYAKEFEKNSLNNVKIKYVELVKS